MSYASPIKTPQASKLQERDLAALSALKIP